MDKRNHNVTHKIYDVLNNVKGFEVAMGNPKNGTIILRHEGISFYLKLDPIFNDTDEGRKSDNAPFDEIVRTHSWILK